MGAGAGAGAGPGAGAGVPHVAGLAATLLNCLAVDITGQSIVTDYQRVIEPGLNYAFESRERVTCAADRC